MRETADPAGCGLDFHTVRIPTANARTLHGWLIPAPSAAVRPTPAVVVLHGWGGNAQMMLPLAAALHRAGFAALFIDARCHGLSDDDDFASLPRFAEDVSQACDWLRAHASDAAIDPTRIALLGHSVGGGAVLLAAAWRGDPAAVVSVSAFAHPAEMMRRWLAGKRIPPLLGRYVLRHVEATIGHRFDDIAPLRSIAALSCPVLVVHGAQDPVVPPDDARRLYAAAAGRGELLILPGDHESFADLPGELHAVTAFLRRACVPGVARPPPDRAQI